MVPESNLMNFVKKLYLYTQDFLRQRKYVGMNDLGFALPYVQ
jgi:hypothetical protein